MMLLLLLLQNNTISATDTASDFLPTNCTRAVAELGRLSCGFAGKGREDYLIHLWGADDLQIVSGVGRVFNQGDYGDRGS